MVRRFRALMTPDTDALNAKRAELVEAATNVLGSDSAELADRLVDVFCRLSPPEQTGQFHTLVIAHSGGYRGGQSRKPGNLRLNWKRLCGDVPDMVLTGAGAVALPWLIPFAALSIWNKFWCHSKISLTKEQAASLVAMWARCDDDHIIPTARALDEINALFAVYQWPTLSQPQFQALLDDLVTLDCIEHDKSKDSIWLREWVKITYT